MYESETFVYLDVQKTGSSFIIHFLNRFCREQRVLCERHRPIRADAGTGKFHFISARDPLDQYLSLFSFGCDGNGTIVNRLTRRGHGYLYERSARAFQRWLEFVLEPSNAHLVAVPYAKAAERRLCTVVGLQTFRFLHLAFPDPEETLAKCTTKSDLVGAYQTKTPVSVVIRHSHFVEDLKELVRTHLSTAVYDVDLALKFLDDARPRNCSDRVDRDCEFRIEQQVRDWVREREWFFYEGAVPL